MNEQVREQVISALKSPLTPTRSVDSLVPEIAKTLNIRQEEVHRTLQLMEDDGLITYPGTSRTGIRLTLKGEQSTAPRAARVKKYMRDNWLVLTALGLSVLGTLSGVAGTVIALLALFKQH